MPRLNEILGALMADIASARHIADQHTLLLAKRYREDPLLRSMSIPRIRLPEVVVDLPLLIERCGDTHTAEETHPGVSSQTREPSREFLRAAEQSLKELDPPTENTQTEETAAPASPVLHVLVGADELKDHGGPGGSSVVRLKLVLREEAMEWTTDEDTQDGQRGEGTGRLIPE